jgi:cytochrome c biogenesis protein CcmG/thiol:disulfide interchange protein DsbE
MKRRVIIAIDAALLVIVLLLLVRRAMPQAAAALGLGRAGAAAPAFTLASLDGDSLSLADLRGRVVLVNFWATWCKPCRTEMPGFERVYRERAADGFTIVGIATDTWAGGRIGDFAAGLGITYPILLADERVEQDYGGVRAIPQSFLIDRRGRIHHRVTGYMPESVLRSAVDRLLEE